MSKTPMDSAVEFPKLTDKHRIRYRHRDAHEAVEMGLLMTEGGRVRTNTGDLLLYNASAMIPARAIRTVAAAWLGENPVLVLEAVIPPPFTPYKGMQLVDAAIDEVWTYWPERDGEYAPWFSSNLEHLTPGDIKAMLATGELEIFTPEATSE